jgi:vacuolar-type H+-ATPase subunit I/STV1
MSWHILASALIGALASWYVTDNYWDAKHNGLIAKHATASEAALTSALEEQKRRLTAIDKVSADGEQSIQAVRVADSGADDSADRLRQQLDAIRSNARRELSSAATQRETDRQTIDMLAGLYQRADERARTIAAAYEEARARGMSCQASYESVCR